MSDEERARIIRRLRAVGESLGCIQAQVEAGAPCGQVLNQLGAVQAEMQALKTRMLECQIRSSKRIIQFHPSVDHRLAELHRLIDLYNTLIQST